MNNFSLDLGLHFIVTMLRHAKAFWGTPLLGAIHGKVKAD